MPASQRVPERVGREVSREWFGTELGQRLGELINEIDGSELADIDETELVSTVEIEDGAGE